MKHPIIPTGPTSPSGPTGLCLHLARVLLLVGFILGSAATTPAAEPKSAESPGIFTLVAENDVFRGTDQHYTHGTRLSYYSGEIREDWLKRVAELLPHFRHRQQEVWRTNLTLGHNIYTPADITISTLQQAERPYAGYLHLGLGLVRAERDEADRPNLIDSFELQLGVVGPLAQGREIQTWWHANVSDSPKPMGWDHELRNEPAINLYWDRQWRRALREEGRIKSDYIPHLGLALGNIDSHLGGGITLRLGGNLSNDNGPPRIRPSLPGAGYFRRIEGWSGYIFIGGEVRLVGRNIFLDGNSFRASHRVDKRFLLLDAQYGIVLTRGGVKLAITNIVRGREFRNQQRPDRFTAFSLSWQR